jgi:hypothetical protein
MASPFRVFRKYQKTLLVVAGVICMFVFVIGDSLFSYLSGTSTARAGTDHDAGAVAVHWDGGKLSNQQLSDLVVRRRVLNNFLKAVEAEGRRPAYEAGVDPRPLRVDPLIAADTPQEGVERSVVQTRLFADAAREAGMKVSNDAILQYLDELGRGNVSREKMRAMLGGIQSGSGRMSIDTVIDALRDQMLMHNYINSQQFALETLTPQQRWADWLRVNDRVVVEAVAVPAESFLAGLPEPTDAELNALYEKYKEREATPELAYGTTELPSATPGFKIPRKIDLQFLQANYDEHLAETEKKITDAEIAKYYDEHKDLFEKADVDLTEDTGKKDTGQTKNPPKSESHATKVDTKNDAEKSKSTEDAKKSGEPAKKETKPSPTNNKSSNNAEKSSPPESSGTTQPTGKDEKPKTKDGKPDSAPTSKKQSLYRGYRLMNVFRLAAFEQDAEKKNSAATTTGSAEAKTEKRATTSDSKSAASTAEKSAAQSGAAPQDSKAADAAKKSAAAPANGPSIAPAAPSAATKAAPGAPAAADASKATPPGAAQPASKKPVQYQPLAEVKDVIRKRLAVDKLGEQLSETSKDIQGQLETEFTKWRFSDAQATSDGKQQTPAPPKALTDLAPLAQKYGWKVVRTGPKSGFEVRDMPVGKSYAVETNNPLIRLLFAGHDLELYQPVTTVEPISKDFFVIQKLSDMPARVPAFAEVKADVVKAWKKQKAAEAAEKRAKELAAKAQEAKKPLTEVFADEKNLRVVRTDAFSELTSGDVAVSGGQTPRLRLSQPDGIVAPGPLFMQRVFTLKDGQVDALLNHDHSIAYVVRIVEHQPAAADLRSMFVAEANSWSRPSSLNQSHMQELVDQMREDVLGRSNLTWDREPDKLTKDQQRDEG